MADTELIRPLNEDDVADLLWLFDFPAGEITGPGSVIPTAIASTFWHGSVAAELADDGQIGVTARVLYTGLPQVLSTELERLNFLVLLGRGDRLSAKFRAHPGNYQLAKATVTFRGDFSELSGAALLVADDNRYCFDHIHCVGCGQLAAAGLETYGWSRMIDNGPGDLPLYVCTSPGCWDEFMRQSIIHPAWH